MTGREVAENTLNVIISKLGRTPSCPICQNNNWTVLDKISLAGTIDPTSNSVNPGSGLPSVNLICDNCGFVASFNPKLLGTM